MKRYNQVVIGSNSYLGVNLCMKLDPETTLLISRSPAENIHAGFEFMQCDLSMEQLPAIDCSVVYVLARPISQSENELQEFYSLLDISLRNMLSVNPSLVIHFISTSLVFASEEPGELTVRSSLDLRQPYEKYKYTMENCLKTCSARHPLASFNVYRIPLLIGGHLRSTDLQRQLFYRMYTNYKEGERWQFSETTPEYGTSYLDVTDFSAWLVTGTFTGGYHLFLPSSGNITYRELQHEFSNRSFPLSIKTTKGCPSSFLILKNNTPLVKRKFSELFNP